MSELLLNRYEPLSEAGSGGFAKVIVAYDTHLQREVAIKCLPLEEDATAPAAPAVGRFAKGRSAVTRSTTGFLAAEERFASLLGGPSHTSKTQVLPAAPSISIMDPAAAIPQDLPGLDEARAAAHLNDPNIVGIHDFQIQDGMAYLIMEYVEGVSLTDLITKCPDALDADVIASVFKAVAHALQVAHANSVLHLDIKPDNVLITPAGQVKVVDFGLARLVNETGMGEAATGGTIGYMPPEQMRQEELDQRCDEWALAALTYHLMAGANPFVVASLEEAEDAIYDAELVVPSLCKEGFDEAIDDIMFCALDPYREDRYDTVKDFARELQPCLGDPKAGKSKLKRLVAALTDQPAQEDTSGSMAPVPEPEEWSERLSLVDSLNDRAVAIIMRIWAALNAGVVGAVAITNLPVVQGWTDPVSWGLLAIMVVAGAVLPHVGALVSFEVLGVCLVMCGMPFVGAPLMVVSALWWFFSGRFGNAQANTALSVVACGALGGAPLAVLLTGWFCNAKDSALTALQQLLTAFVLAGLGSCSLMGWQPLKFGVIAQGADLGANYLTLLSNPETWIMAASWLAAALVMAGLCRWGRQWLIYLGGVLGGLCLGAGLVIGTLFTSGGVTFVPAMSETIAVVAVTVLMVIISLAGNPRERQPDEYLD